MPAALYADQHDLGAGDIKKRKRVSHRRCVHQISTYRADVANLWRAEALEEATELRDEISHFLRDSSPRCSCAKHEYAILNSNVVKAGNMREAQERLRITISQAPSDAQVRRATDDAGLGIVIEKSQCILELSRDVENSAFGLR